MIWNFQDALTRRLVLWSVLTIVGGLVLLAVGDPFWRGVGLQAVAWGVIDALIAFFGQRGTNKRRATARGDGVAARAAAANLRRLLWINTGLDVLYVGGGLFLATTAGAAAPFIAGNGWGVVLQGAFLFVFDLLHALAVPGEPTDSDWTAARLQPSWYRVLAGRRTRCGRPPSSSTERDNRR